MGHTIKTLDAQAVGMRPVSAIILADREEGRRVLASAFETAQAEVIRQGTLPGVDDLPRLLEAGCDVLVVDLDGNPEPGLDVVEAAYSIDPALTVMVYGSRTDHGLLVRCMRAGAREFLSEPLSSTAVAEALVRAAARREEIKALKKTSGKTLVFAGAKGGAGVTTIAANFAVALASQSGESVALVDLNLQLGDAALSLGLSSEFSTVDALQQEKRLDSEMLSKLFVRHGSGLNVLAAPNELTAFEPTAQAVTKLMQVVRSDFAWVVVDAGSHYTAYAQSLFDAAAKVYLIAQVSVTDLRNAHQLIQAHFQGEDRRKLEVVLNRFNPRGAGIDAEGIEKALAVSPRWKVPSDFNAVRNAQNTATALASNDGPVSRILASMAVDACGKPPAETRKRRFSLF